MTALENLLAEIRALAPAGASVSVDDVIWSHRGGETVTREWRCTVHIDDVPCTAGGHGMIAHERADAPAILVALVGARLLAKQCVCSACKDDRAKAAGTAEAAL